jgi:hypothetical protein
MLSDWHNREARIEEIHAMQRRKVGESERFGKRGLTLQQAQPQALSCLQHHQTYLTRVETGWPA